MHWPDQNAAETDRASQNRERYILFSCAFRGWAIFSVFIPVALETNLLRPACSNAPFIGRKTYESIVNFCKNRSSGGLKMDSIKNFSRTKGKRRGRSRVEIVNLKLFLRINSTGFGKTELISWKFRTGAGRILRNQKWMPKGRRNEDMGKGKKRSSYILTKGNLFLFCFFGKT